jgi:acyl CoA:acetate/3-ketoacid CoA transferase alpha subunit
MPQHCFLLDSTMRVRENEGSDKLLSLKEAVSKHIRPGMALHIGENANAAVREVIRRFYGNKPDFTLISSTAEDYVLDMVHLGQVKKLICAACSEFYQRRGPSKIMQRAYRENVTQIENWSLHTIVQRLTAHA